MQARRWQGVAALAAVTALARGLRERSRGEDGRRHRRDAAEPVQGRDRLLADGAARGLRRAVHPGPALRARLRDARARTRVNGRKIELTIVDDGTDPTKAVAAGKDLIGKGYKILAGSVSSGVALQMAPLAEQNKVLFISGPAAADAITGHQQVHVPLGPPDLPGRQDRGDVPQRASARRSTVFAQDSAFGAGNYAAVNLIVGSAGPQGQPAARAALGAGLHAVRAAGEAGEPGPALRRLGRHDRARDVARARAAGRLRRLEQDRDRARRAGDLADVRRRRREDRLPLALRLHGAEEQGERLPRQLDAEARPGAGPLHAGRLRRRPDDRARARQRRTATTSTG